MVFGQINYQSHLQTETNEYRNLYQFDEEQVKRLDNIMQRKFSQLEEIESLRKKDPKKFRIKRRAIFKGANASIERMLTKVQMAIHDQELSKRRLMVAEEMKNLDNSEEEMERLKDLKSGVKEY